MIAAAFTLWIATLILLISKFVDRRHFAIETLGDIIPMRLISFKPTSLSVPKVSMASGMK